MRNKVIQSRKFKRFPSPYGSHQSLRSGWKWLHYPATAVSFLHKKGGENDIGVNIDMPGIQVNDNNGFRKQDKLHKAFLGFATVILAGFFVSVLSVPINYASIPENQVFSSHQDSIAFKLNAINVGELN